MSMTIDIGITSSDPKKVNKNYTSIASGVILEPTSIIDQISPVFVVNYNAAYLTANYVKCSSLGRRYFCTVSVNTAKRCVLTCTVDALSSFDLSNCMIAVMRNEGIGAPTLYPDNKLPVYPTKNNITSIVMESDNADLNRSYIGGFYEYVLTVIAGSPTE